MMKGEKKIELVERIGLDRIKLVNFRIIDIDFKKFLAHDNVKLDKDAKYNYDLENGKYFRWLKIEDYQPFGILMEAGVRKNQEMKQDYAWLEITISEGKYGNLQNMTMIEYRKRVLEIFEYIYKEYGITVRIDDMKFGFMEINCTFRISDKFSKYHRLLSLWMLNLPDSFKKIQRFDKAKKKEQRLETETFYRSNTTTEIKIYDKTKQLNEKRKANIVEDYIRIEISLKNAAKIIDVFDSNKWTDIEDKDINSFFYIQFLRLFEKQYVKWKNKNAVELRKLITKHKKLSKYRWIGNLLIEVSNREQQNQIPVLLDINDLLTQVKAMDKNNHYSRVAKSVIEQCKVHDVYMQGDALKAEEIIMKVHDMYDFFMNSQEVA